MEIRYFNKDEEVFKGYKAPESGFVAGYGAMIGAYQLEVPLPDRMVWISNKNRQGINREWRVLGLRYAPGMRLYDQILFSLKYEGVSLLFFKKLFDNLSEAACIELVQIEPLGQYSRRIWFLYEWLMRKELPIGDLKSGNYQNVVDEKLQFALASGVKSKRHRLINNLPGSPDFCPLIFKTDKLTSCIEQDLNAKNTMQLGQFNADLLTRASAFLLLKDSRASFNIEGENPMPSRAMRWGKELAEAGLNTISKAELERLQHVVLENAKFCALSRFGNFDAGCI
jgi:hypothetical protein